MPANWPRIGDSQDLLDRDLDLLTGVFMVPQLPPWFESPSR
jgi:hypothetical protein